MRVDSKQFLQVGITLSLLACGLGLFIKKMGSITSTHSADNSIQRRLAAEKDSASSKDPLAEKSMVDIDKFLDAAEKDEDGSFHSHKQKSARKIASLLVLDDYGGKFVIKGKNVCNRMEYRGDGPKRTQVFASDWNRVLDQFEIAKHLLREWLAKNKGEIPASSVSFMESQLLRLRLVAPPSKDELEINWRGIGVYGRDSSSNPVIRMGSGFIKLVLEQPKRSQFEMTRLVAQSWAPCEFENANQVWPCDKLLNCLGARDEDACSVGSFSEAAWAVSSSLAVALSPPGCVLPALIDDQKNQCLKTLGVTEAQNESSEGSKELKK